jgi:NAD(P)-dependent dehydrogenase (short-subunit alcohol dehydrogenase family)
MARWLEGRVALVTGGASGIGRAVVARFVREGARVGILDISPEAFQPDQAELDAVHVVGGDVRFLADNVRAVEETVERFGKLDVFVGNTGIGDAFVELKDLAPDVIEQAFDEMFAVNVKGYLLGAKAVLPELVATGGCMIFTLSNSSFLADGGGPLYIASKHACLGLVRQLAHELAPRIRVNAVAPGGTVTDFRLLASFGLDEQGRQQRVYEFDDGHRAADKHEFLAEVAPLKLSPEPSDHAGAYVLLASEENSRNITGAVINSDGGLGVRGLRRVRGGDDLTAALRSRSHR